MTEVSEDTLLSRVADRIAGPEDWEMLENAGSTDPDLWMRLAQVLRNDSLLETAVAGHARIAESVDPPPAITPGSRPVRRGYLAAAAALVIAASAFWILDVPSFFAGNQSREHSLHEQSPARGTALAHLENYLKEGLAEGRVLEELPQVLLDHGPDPAGGGLEVFYIRRFLERKVVDGAWLLGQDEYGAPQAARVAARDISRGSSL